ncbi:MAG: phenylalanine--tRNA ligase subunit alpha [Erysipelotrichaceae bacterium]|nr:phenylalanine--tRNA ligase subunit alpha [Erysipelotrichaceae bacterium]MDO5438700.1 phenylalanine--tRNA ligase subunit alpha [Erysipelotrichaceae bacterium]
MDTVTLKNEALQRIEKAEKTSDLEQLRIEYLAKKGTVQQLMVQMKDLSPEEKPAFGQKVNELKKVITQALEDRQKQLAESELNERLKTEKIDISLDASSAPVGSLHPLTLITQQIEDIFVGLGYEVAEGPEVELDLYNFEKANIPADHPSRDMQDTFYIDPNTLLRTHTTAIQMRVLEAAHGKTPIKLVCPGKVYRRDDDDATHSHQFMQSEGLVVGEGITLADLKGTLQFMIESLFKEGTKIRFRPSYFPFTEPSFEVDMSCHICGGKGCNVCKHTGWIEILGSGMVHPHVLEINGFDPKKYTGFAFGVGLERIAMLKYGITDIRDLYTNDIRFLQGFKKYQ